MAEGNPAMGDACCIERPDDKEAQHCPVSLGIGRRVGWTTVAALTIGTAPPRQEIWLCRDANCDVVYFGSRGLELRASDVRSVPGFKVGSDGLACYCFQTSRQTIEDEVRTRGSSPSLEFIRTQVREKGCACEVRNPTGRCCLEDIRRMVEETSKKGAA